MAPMHLIGARDRTSPPAEQNILVEDPAVAGPPRSAHFHSSYAFAAASSDVQCAQRTALSGTLIAQYGHSRVVVAAGFAVQRFTCRISRNTANATIRKFSTVLMNIP